MVARFVMDTDYLTGIPTETVMAAQWRLQTSPHRTIYVVDNHLTFAPRIHHKVLPIKNAETRLNTGFFGIIGCQPNLPKMECYHAGIYVRNQKGVR